MDDIIANPIKEPFDLSLEYISDCTNNFTSKILGEGAFGSVYFGCDKELGLQFAIKRVPLQVQDDEILNQITISFKREISVCLDVIN